VQDSGSFTYAVKKPLLDIAHRDGAFYVFVLAIGFAGLAGIIERCIGGSIWEMILGGGLIFLNCLLIYWLLFDMRFGSGVQKGVFFLGTTAAMDIRLTQYLGEQAGKLKALIILAIIVLIHYLHLLNFYSF
jgi:hypothetical protein